MQVIDILLPMASASALAPTPPILLSIGRSRIKLSDAARFVKLHLRYKSTLSSDLLIRSASANAFALSSSISLPTIWTILTESLEGGENLDYRLIWFAWVLYWSWAHWPTLCCLERQNCLRKRCQTTNRCSEQRFAAARSPPKTMLTIVVLHSRTFANALMPTRPILLSEKKKSNERASARAREKKDS